jgi:Nif-specific regulatory protein
MLIEALKITRGNQQEAARKLAITNRQMGLRVRHYGINWRAYRP